MHSFLLFSCLSSFPTFRLCTRMSVPANSSPILKPEVKPSTLFLPVARRAASQSSDANSTGPLQPEQPPNIKPASTRSITIANRHRYRNSHRSESRYLLLVECRYILFAAMESLLKGNASEACPRSLQTTRQASSKFPPCLQPDLYPKPHTRASIGPVH